MSRRRAIHVTDGELRKLREPCKSPSCEGHAAQMVLSRASWKECTTCGHQWDFHDASSKVITREQRDELAKPRAGSQHGGEAEEQRAQARRREQYKQEMSDMAKKKAATKPTAKRVGKTAERKTTKTGLSMCGFIREFAKKNPKASGEDIAKATKTAVGVMPAAATVTIQSSKGRKD